MTTPTIQISSEAPPTPLSILIPTPRSQPRSPSAAFEVVFATEEGDLVQPVMMNGVDPRLSNPRAGPANASQPWLRLDLGGMGCTLCDRTGPVALNAAFSLSKNRPPAGVAETLTALLATRGVESVKSMIALPRYVPQNKSIEVSVLLFRRRR